MRILITIHYFPISNMFEGSNDGVAQSSILSTQLLIRKNILPSHIVCGEFYTPTPRGSSMHRGECKKEATSRGGGGKITGKPWGQFSRGDTRAIRFVRRQLGEHDEKKANFPGEGEYTPSLIPRAIHTKYEHVSRIACDCREEEINTGYAERWVGSSPKVARGKIPSQSVI